MKGIIFSILLIFSILFSIANANRERDICVLGGGGSGMSAAIFAKDKGYDVLVIEKREEVGGNVYTVKIGPKSTTQIYWKDIGVQVIYNTTGKTSELNTFQSLLKREPQKYHSFNINDQEKLFSEQNLKNLGIKPKNIQRLRDLWTKSKNQPTNPTSKSAPTYTPGTYLINTVDFVKRFVNEPLITYSVNSSIPSYGADFTTKQLFNGVFPVINFNLDFLNAFIEYSTIIAGYPWLNTGDYPEPLPEDLTLKFSEFITKYNLTALGDLWRLYLVNYRPYDDKLFDSFSTLSAMSDLGQWVLDIFGVPFSGFTVRGGLQQIYKGIEKQLGYDNVWKNMEVTSVKRPRSGRVELEMYDKSKPNRKIKVKCKKLLVGFPPILNSLDAFDLDSKEFSIFKELEIFTLYPFLVNITAVNNPFNGIYNLNLTNPNFYPYHPYVNTLFNTDQFGPASGVLVVKKPSSKLDAYVKIIKQISNVPSFTVNANGLYDTLIERFLSPHFTISSLKKPKNPFTLIKEIQGQRNTFWLYSTDWQHSIWHNTFKLVNTYF